MKFSRQFIVQFFKFSVVGVLNTIIDWLIFLLLVNQIGIFQNPQYEVGAKAISFSLAVINSFILNSLWTFRDEVREGINKAEKKTIAAILFSRFFLVSVIGLVLNTLVFYLARPLTGSVFEVVLLAQLSALFIATFASVLWNFLANKYWTYKINQEQALKTQKNLVIYIIAGLLLVIMLINSILVMRKDSGVVDEVAHIPAGYSYLKKLDFRINPEHPPLAKAISAIPLMFLHLKEPFGDSSWQGINQWELGWHFLYKSGNSADLILFWSRLPMILLTLALGLLLFIWAKKRLGARIGLFILFLFIFSPNILAHSHWVTTDVAAAFGFLLAIFYYDKFIESRTRQNLIFAGLAFGIAQLLKFSCILLIPIFGLYIIFRAILYRKDSGFWTIFLKDLWAQIQILVIGFLIIWAVYLVFTWKMPLDISRQLIDQSIPENIAFQFNHFLKSLAAIPVLSALGHYLLGLMMVSAHAGGGHTTFLLGNFSQTGWWYYFPLSFFFKVPLPILLLIVIAIVNLLRKNQAKNDIWFIILLLVPLLIYWFFSINSKLNIGIRHLIPTLPFFYLLIGRAVKPVILGKWGWQKISLLVISLWYLTESVFAFPHYMAYFNEIRLLLGLQKHQILVDSNLDWGQDLKRLAEYCQKNNISEIKVDYFGGGIPSYYIPQAQEWHSKYGQTKGFLAVSVTFYQMSKYFGPREGLPDYSYLDNIKPEAVIGDSILVFNLGK